LQQALVGESTGEEQLFSSGSILSRSGSTSELDYYFQKLKVDKFNCNMPLFAHPYLYTLHEKLEKNVYKKRMNMVG